MKTISKDSLDKIIAALKSEGYMVIGPVLKDGAIVYDELNSIKELPAGWGDEQEAGQYRIRKRNDGALFGYNVGPQSWKKFLFPGRLKLWKAERNPKGFDIEPDDSEVPKYAFIGVRSCELNAMFIQNKVFNNGMFADSYYNKAKKNIFVIAMNCAEAGGTCFCVSMKTGPKAKEGYDIALTEILNPGEHYFVADEGTQHGSEIMELVESIPATEENIKAADNAVKNAEENMGRVMETDGIKSLLYKNHANPIWDSIAKRCLSCANCTMVCPTCFCSNVEDVTDLSGDHTERWRSWDSCFNLDFSKVAGGSFRTSIKARYRQWMTHKLASWIDQFGTSGCVGCGRCISWCPVGIDITKEVTNIKQSLKT